MPDADIAFYLVGAGMNAASPAARINETQFVRASNCRVERELLTTRYGCRLIPLEGDNLEFYERENTQGALFFNPAQGQGAIVYGRNEGMIAQAVGGRKFAVHFEGTIFDGIARLEDVTNGHTSDGDLHLVILSQWETYVLAGDFVSSTFIWDGMNPAEISTGYISSGDRERSMVPNAGGVMAYVHGRGTIVINARLLLTGNLLSSQSLTTAEDIRRFTEQVYQGTAQYFSPPSAMGEITAAAILPIKDTAHGHGDLMIHAENGIFSIDLNVFPRENWANTAMVKTAYIGGGATGPYAVALVDGDQFFRSQAGIQSLRSARAEVSLVGSPQQPLSDEVETYFQGDSPEYLRFASFTAWPMERRLFVTCYPIVSGRWRWHRGIVSLAFDPVPVQRTPEAWEGVWTVPVEAGGIVQTVCGRFNSRDRFFALCRNAAGKNVIAEFIPELTHDVLEDGSTRRIRSQVVTRRMDCKQPFLKKNFEGGSIFLEGITGRVDFGVWFRPYGKREWILWNSGYVDNGECACDDLRGPAPYDKEVVLGALPSKASETTSRYVQFLIRWAGYCSIEALRLTFNSGNLDENQFEAENLRLCVKESALAEYNDFEYAEDSEADSWLSMLPKK